MSPRDGLNKVGIVRCVDSGAILVKRAAIVTRSIKDVDLTADEMDDASAAISIGRS
jgi:hypothetical protein